MAILNETVLTSLPSLSHYIIMWTLLGEDEYHSTNDTYSNSVLYVTQSSLLFVVVVAVGQNIGGCLSFTAVMILINHSVVADDLGKVNGLGQSMASLTRAIGPAIGMWICMATMHTYILYIYNHPCTVGSVHTHINTNIQTCIHTYTGGALWSLSMRYDFIFFNFIATALVLFICLIINSQLPQSLAFKKTSCHQKKDDASSS